MSDPSRAHAYYSGYIQGVGFRYTTQLMARNFTVTGYVRNMADGRVELEAEGERAEVERFLGALEERWGRRISEKQLEWLDPTGADSSFEIHF